MKQGSITFHLFFQNLLLLFIFGLFTTIVSYFTIYKSLQEQFVTGLEDEFFEIRFVSENYSDTLAVIKAESYNEHQNNPLYRIYSSEKKLIYNSSEKASVSSDQEIIQSMFDELDPETIFVKKFIEDNSNHYLYLAGKLQHGRLLVIVQSTDEVIEILEHSVLDLIINSALVALILLVCSWYLTKQSLKELRSIIDSAKSIAHLTPHNQEREILAYQVQESTELARAFNELLISIQQSITEVHRMTDDMSHDFKTALNRIRCQAEALINLEDDNPTNDGLLQILKECDNLALLVNRILDISRYSLGGKPSDLTQVNPSEILLEMLQLYSPSFEEKGLSLNQNLESVELESSTKMLEIIFSNLLDNMVKYTPQSGQCSIRGAKIDKSYVLDFENTFSSTLTDEDYQKIFNRFVRLDASRTADHGHGLGLNMCQTICTNLGSKIMASRGSLGFKISFFLPLSDLE